MSNKIRRALPLAVASAVASVAVGLAVPGAAQAWLHPGAETRYPAEGGTWQYGFWDAKVRSYYTVSKCHGSSVIYNGSLTRSINTAAGQKSIAEAWGINTSGASDSYYYRTC